MNFLRIFRKFLSKQTKNAAGPGGESRRGLRTIKRKKEREEGCVSLCPDTTKDTRFPAEVLDSL